MAIISNVVVYYSSMYQYFDAGELETNPIKKQSVGRRIFLLKDKKPYLKFSSSKNVAILKDN